MAEHYGCSRNGGDRDHPVMHHRKTLPHCYTRESLMRKHDKSANNRRTRRIQPLTNWLHAIHENQRRIVDVHDGLDLDQLRRFGIAPPEPPRAKLESVLRILQHVTQRLGRP
jgi:hypothetical protein